MSKYVHQERSRLQIQLLLLKELYLQSDDNATAENDQQVFEPELLVQEKSTFL